MSDAVDVYTDQFQLNMGPYGATLNFLLSDPTPAAPGSPPKTDLKATVRMSAEHLKVMSYIILRQVRLYEKQTNTTVQIPVQMLNSMGISPEDWDSLWRKE